MKFIHLVPSAFVFLQMGALALGMASWLGGEDDEEAEEAASGGDDFDMDDDFDDFDEEFGGLDDMDDGGGGGEGAGQNVTELQNRIDQLETEMANVSSKANTVRSENEQISESVDDVEENVRKLLEIYEMVTRGVNPFVDDVQAGGGMAEGGGNSFGLFDDDGENPDDEEELDDELASAEAEDFFADDALDEFDEDAGDGLDDFEMDDFDEDVEDEDDGADGEEGDGSGTSFEDLKAEYESGDAEWADGELDEDGIDADEKDDLGFEDEEGLEGDDDAGDLFLDDDIEDEELDADEDEPDGGEDDPEADAFEELDETDGVDEADDGLEAEPEPDPTPAPSASGLLSAGGNETPHLQEPPTGYLADVVVFEWLTGLLDEFGPRNTVRTLNYYERIGWIGDEAREHLFTVLEGLSDSDHVYRQEMGTTELTMDDHLQSLEYIEELADGDLERGIIERCENLHVDGIQR